MNKVKKEGDCVSEVSLIFKWCIYIYKNTHTHTHTSKIVLLMYVLFRCRYVSEPKAYNISATVECDVSVSVSAMLNLIHYFS